MALKKCKECGAEISTSADKCPKCGAPSTAQNIQNIGCALMAIGAVIIFIFLLVSGLL